MAYFDTTWYCNSGDQLTTGISTTGYYATAKRPQNIAVAAGMRVRPFTTPQVHNERIYICIVAGTTANTVDATWPNPIAFQRGGKVVDGTVTWQECTGGAGVNGDLVNTPSWTTVKGKAVSQGQVIKRNSGASLQICSTAGTAGGGAEPAFSDTAGVVTNDGVVRWTSIGAVGGFAKGSTPHARLGCALLTNWFSDGNTLYVADTHKESATQSLLIGGGGLSNFTVGKILCHKKSGSYPPVPADMTTGASITIIGGLFSIFFQPDGHFYIHGLTFRSSQFGLVIGRSSSASGSVWYYFDACAFEVASSSTTGGELDLGVAGGSMTCTIYFNNTTVKFGAGIRNSIYLFHVQFFWQNTAQILAPGSSIPRSLFRPPFSQTGNAVATLEGLDLSQIQTVFLDENVPFVSGSTIVGHLLLKDCKLHPSVAISQTKSAGFIIQLARCGSDVNANKSARYAAEGIEATEPTITRVDGAIDPAGQRQSRKIITSAFAEWIRPYQAEPFARWYAPTGTPVTVTVYGATPGSLPLNDEIWLEIEYLGFPDSLQGLILTTTKANMWATPLPVVVDASAWNGAAGVKFKLVAELLPPPQLAGFLHARVRAGKKEATYYIDPQIYLS